MADVLPHVMEPVVPTLSVMLSTGSRFVPAPQISSQTQLPRVGVYVSRPNAAVMLSARMGRVLQVSAEWCVGTMQSVPKASGASGISA